MVGSVALPTENLIISIIFKRARVQAQDARLETLHIICTDRAMVFHTNHADFGEFGGK